MSEVQFNIHKGVECNCKEDDDCEKSWLDELQDWWKQFGSPSFAERLAAGHRSPHEPTHPGKGRTGREAWT